MRFKVGFHYPAGTLRVRLTQILHQYKKTKLWGLDNQFNTLFPLTFSLYPNTTVKLRGRCKISV
jgi:hypothetical protein